tara:strand:- start:1581 stop:2771 length:1191 start_codon:yes stop_codon:yes gene_type:complete
MRPNISTLIFLILAVFCFPSLAITDKIIIPDIPGIKVTAGTSVKVPAPGRVGTAMAYRFKDGRIAVGNGANSMYSSDNGKSWKRGPDSRLQKVMLDLGDGEAIAISRNTKRRTDGKFEGSLVRSTDNWKTFITEKPVLDIPNASFTVTGSGDRRDGFLFHHGLVKLKDGNLLASMYGNYDGDTELCEGYPPELGQRKYRSIVITSTDNGRTWGDHVHVAYDKMLGRGIPDDHAMLGKSIPEGRHSVTSAVPAITQEGFRESDLVEAPNGDLLCVMRSGGRNGVPEAALFPTPLYCSISRDQGKTWSLPKQIADRGVNPNLVVMSNGIIVCTYSRPGNWLIFSDDNGQTWKGAFQFGNTGAYNYIEEVGDNLIQVYHEVGESGSRDLWATFFTVMPR